MKNKKLKTPSDYPQFYCRMNEEDKEEIEQLLGRIIELHESLKKPGQLKMRRNDFITQALKVGLKGYERKMQEASAKRKNSN